MRHRTGRCSYPRNADPLTAARRRHLLVAALNPVPSFTVRKKSSNRPVSTSVDACSFLKAAADRAAGACCLLSSKTVDAKHAYLSHHSPCPLQRTRCLPRRYTMVLGACNPRRSRRSLPALEHASRPAVLIGRGDARSQCVRASTVTALTADWHRHTDRVHTLWDQLSSHHPPRSNQHEARPRRSARGRSKSWRRP